MLELELGVSLARNQQILIVFTMTPLQTPVDNIRLD